MDAEVEAPILWSFDAELTLEKILMLGKIEGRKRREQQRMSGWMHHQLNGHEFEQTPGDSEGQRNLACYGSWNHRVRHDLKTEQ